MTQQVNLYQPIFRKEEKKFSTVAMLQAIGIVAIGVAAFYAYAWWQTQVLKSELQRAQQSHAAASKQMNDVADRYGKMAADTSLDTEITQLQGDLSAKQHMQGILQSGVFSNTRGFSDYLVAFARQSVPGVWITGFDITGAADQMTLAGRSTDPQLVPRYMQKLSSEKVLSGIVFNVFEMNRPKPDAKAANADYIEFEAKTAAIEDSHVAR
ncbi:MAG: PilN domain-containing protein [Sulfuricaulis sp.]